MRGCRGGLAARRVAGCGAILARVDASARPDGDELRGGDTIGGYRIEELIGEGGMGQVFRAVSADGHTVAIKVMKSRFVADAQFTRRFLREGRAAAEVEHEHLVGVLEVGEQDGRQYLVMRFVPGETLEQRIARTGPLSVGAVDAMVAQVGAGLDALHAHGIVHRDVKASNILFDADGSAALTDFGLAKGAGYSVLTRPGQMMGTLDYIAPELIRGEEASAASDLYALGCAVFEAVAGKPPFAGKSIFQVGMAHLDEPPADPCAERGDMPVSYGEAVCLALAKDPGERPGSAEVYARLLALASGG